MPGIEDGIVGQGEEHFADTMHQRLPIAAVKVGATYSTGEEHISVESRALFFKIKGHPAWGMPWGEKHLEAKPTYFEHLLRLQFHIR